MIKNYATGLFNQYRSHIHKLLLSLLPASKQNYSLNRRKHVHSVTKSILIIDSTIRYGVKKYAKVSHYLKHMIYQYSIDIEIKNKIYQNKYAIIQNDPLFEEAKLNPSVDELIKSFTKWDMESNINIEITDQDESPGEYQLVKHDAHTNSIDNLSEPHINLNAQSVHPRFFCPIYPSNPIDPKEANYQKLKNKYLLQYPTKIKQIDIDLFEDVVQEYHFFHPDIELPFYASNSLKKYFSLILSCQKRYLELIFDYLKLEILDDLYFNLTDDLLDPVSFTFFPLENRFPTMVGRIFPDYDLLTKLRTNRGNGLYLNQQVPSEETLDGTTTIKIALVQVYLPEQSISRTDLYRCADLIRNYRPDELIIVKFGNFEPHIILELKQILAISQTKTKLTIIEKKNIIQGFYKSENSLFVDIDKFYVNLNDYLPTYLSFLSWTNQLSDFIENNGKYLPKISND